VESHPNVENRDVRMGHPAAFPRYPKSKAAGEGHFDFAQGRSAPHSQSPVPLRLAVCGLLLALSFTVS